MNDDIEWLANLLNEMSGDTHCYKGYDKYFQAMENFDENPDSNLDSLDFDNLDLDML